jgi:hypothetical protein
MPLAPIVKTDTAANDDPAVLKLARHRHIVDELAIQVGLNAVGSSPGLCRHLFGAPVMGILAGAADHFPLNVGLFRKLLVNEQNAHGLLISAGTTSQYSALPYMARHPFSPEARPQPESPAKIEHTICCEKRKSDSDH